MGELEATPSEMPMNNLDFRILLLYRIGRTCDGIAQNFEVGYKELRNLRSILIPVLDSKYYTYSKETNANLFAAMKEYYSLSQMDREKNAVTRNELLWESLDQLMKVANRKKLLNIGMAKAEVVQ